MVVSGDVVVSVTSVNVTVVLDGPVTVVAAIEAKMLVIIEYNLALTVDAAIEGKMLVIIEFNLAIFNTTL